MSANAADWLARARQFERRGELLLAYDTALHGLEEHPGDVWLAHRAVLNLAKAGALSRAEAEFQRLNLGESREPDVVALGARIAKDRALAAPANERTALLSHAADLYDAVYRAGGGYYPAVNVATLRLLAGERAAAERVAREVLDLCRDGSPDDAYYLAASCAEAALVLGDIALARDALTRAASHGADLAARATTRRQLRLVCEARGIPGDVLEPLAAPTVIHYSGHMIAPEGRAGRFPARAEREVAAGIRAMLDARGVGFAYGALASGADILFAEALLERGAELHVVLPFAQEEFIEISVDPAGPGWRERFEACLARASSVTYATDDRYLGHEWIFAYGSFVAMGLAVLRAQFLDTNVRQIAVWDGVETTGQAGTGFDVRTWRTLVGESDVIPSRSDLQRTAADSAAPATGRALRAMLFGDVKGFSKLTEAQIPPFVTHVLGAMGAVLERYGDRVLYRNTWGDGLFVVMSDAAAAAECALDLQAAVGAVDLEAHGLPSTLALRLGGHYGPVFEAQDPVQGVMNYFGAHVSRTARIEPVTPPGEVFVTEQFAARLALEPKGYACDYVGQVPAAKSYGTLRMYHLHRRRA
ncbi:MAG TPA: adenylate/guanylate cyclase domain-containing protein [Burkholderiales bacterium]|nr:adenylate/guanylate cyclase domain-containing protein [Burkholderiales bacterium]